MVSAQPYGATDTTRGGCLLHDGERGLSGRCNTNKIYELGVSVNDIYETAECKR